MVQSFVAAKTATEQIMDLRNTQRYLGDPKSRHTCLVTTSQLSQAQPYLNPFLIKQHNMLSYHKVRETIAAKILEFHCCSSDQNRSDILSKHWEQF